MKKQLAYTLVIASSLSLHAQGSLSEAQKSVEEYATSILHPTQQHVTEYVIEKVEQTDVYKKGLAEPDNKFQWILIKAQIAAYALLSTPFCVEREDGTWANVTIKGSDWAHGTQNALQHIKEEREKARIAATVKEQSE